jgi:hypothetical protein
MSTVHVYLNGGPMNQSIQTFQDPEQILEFLVEIEDTAEGPRARYARYSKVKIEPAPKPLRGQMGAWSYIGDRWEEIKENE